jgi:cyclase
MLRPRIIPCLLVHKKGLVKTVKFATPKYVGDPINAVKIFNEKEVDELIVLDIDATANGVEPDYAMIRNLAAECRMPLCYGGGVKTVEQAVRIIKSGVEKVAVSSAAVAKPSLISEIARFVGSQSVVVVLDVRKDRHGRYEVWTHNGRTNTHREPVELARQLAESGAGEVTINSIDHDGEMRGYDLELARRVRAAVTVPMTVLGGVGKLADIETLVREFGIIGAAAGSLFVFKGVYKAVLINYPNRAEKAAITATVTTGARA